MPSTKTVSPRTVRAVQNLRNDGKTWETIGKTLGRSPNWGIQLLKNYDGATGLRKEERQKTGRKRKTTETEDFVMEAVATNFREYSYQDVANVLKEHNLTVISEKTVRNRLKQRGFRKTKAILDELTDTHKEQRVKWGIWMQNQLLLDIRYIHRWWISDEMMVKLGDGGTPKVSQVSCWLF